jgi:hypothetical protein
MYLKQTEREVSPSAWPNQYLKFTPRLVQQIARSFSEGLNMQNSFDAKNESKVHLVQE